MLRKILVKIQVRRFDNGINFSLACLMKTAVKQQKKMLKLNHQRMIRLTLRAHRLKTYLRGTPNVTV